MNRAGKKIQAFSSPPKLGGAGVVAGPSCCCLFCLCVCVVTVVCLTIETKQIESRRPYDTLTIRGGGLSVLSPPLKNRPLPNQPPAKKSPLPPSILKKPTPFPVSPTSRHKIDPFPQSEPQKWKKRFIWQRSRSAERIGIILVSTCPSHQSWLYLPKTDRIKESICTKPAKRPKTSPKPALITPHRTLLEAKRE